MGKETPEQVFWCTPVTGNCIRNLFLALPSWQGGARLARLAFEADKSRVLCALPAAEHHSSERVSGSQRLFSPSPASFLLKQFCLRASW